MAPWPAGEIRSLALDEIGEAYRRYRLSVPEAEAAMARSLRRYGQISPMVVCLREERPEVIDGFKRLAAARVIPGFGRLSARSVEVDERGAKAAIYGLNCVGRRPQELEEAWIVSALVREDGLSQVEAAELLGRHKSWVCRRLALLEKLGPEAREALRQAREVVPPAWDPRLSSAGNRIARQLGYLLDQLGRMETWLHTRGRGELTFCDRGPLMPAFTRLSREARSVAELADDFLAELKVS